MGKRKTNKPAENKTNLPDYVKKLQEKGAVVITGRSRGELEEMLANIPEGVNYYTGAVTTHMSKGLLCVQVNLKA